MFKIAGSICIFLSCLFAGLLKSYKLKKRSESLASLRLAIERMGVEISFTKKRLERIFAELSQDFNLPVFYDTAMMMRSVGLKGAWQENIEAYSREMALADSDMKALESIGDIAGYTGEEQQRCIYTLVKLLELCEAEAKEVYERTGKLYRNMGVLVGLLCVILLF